MRHRLFLIFVPICAALFAAPVQAAPAVRYSTIIAKAKALADKPFQPPKTVPSFLANLSYDQYRKIRFRVDNALWKQSNTHFQVQLIHPGLYYKHAVALHIVDGSGTHKLHFSRSLFDYGNAQLRQKTPKNLGFAGFKLTFPLKGPHSHNQFLVFAGASYFRAVGKNQNWGLSARGLAIDTGLTSGEEFPYFKAFWLVRPSPDAGVMKVYGLLDSQSMTGAYQFIIKPGTQTVMDIKATLFARASIKQLGIAPLTSMFLYGEGADRPQGYWRPEIHDSDGLLIHAGTGEWLWRPLLNPTTLTLNSFTLTDPKGFGLMQRDQNFSHYQDLEARYDHRPSAWVTPLDDWGDGHVQLVEIPSASEANDNIVAFWVPKKPAPVGKPMHFSYRLHWTRQSPIPADIATTRASYIGHGDHNDTTRFVLDFNAPSLQKLARDAAVKGVITVGDGSQLVSHHVEKNPVTGGWRLAFQVKNPSQPLELRAFLKMGDQTLSETWSYMLPPPS